MTIQTPGGEEMNKKRFFKICGTIIVVSILLSACGLFSRGSTQNNDGFLDLTGNDNDSPVQNFVEIESGGDHEPANEEKSSPPSYSAGEPMATQGITGSATEGDRAAGGMVVAEDADVGPPTYPQPIVPPYSEPYPDMFFEDYGVNPFIDTEDDNLSTFATDVDTGAYTLVRNYLNQGFLPPEDAIRVEEFINYFPQGYESPSARDTFAIHIDGAPTPFTESERYQVIRVGVQGFDIPESDRKEASLTFVIDVSGSMSNGNRLGIVQDALTMLVEELRPSDTVAIIAYTDSAWVVLEPTSARHTEEINSAIYSLYPMATTNAEAGLVLGYQVAASAYNSHGINRVILCSDGVANVGSTGPDSIWESIQDYASEGITLTAVGVGMGNYNDVLLEQLADNGDGFYAYVDTHDEAERLFVHDLVSTLQIIAYDAKIQVEFNEDVVSRYRLIGFENRAVADEDFRDNTVDAAEIGAGHSVTALYEIKLHSGARGEIATVHLRWQNPDTYDVHELSKTFRTRDMGDSFRLADPHFQMDVLVAEFAEILHDSYWAEDSSFDEIFEWAYDLQDRLELPEFYEFIELVEVADHMSYR
jgi:Ca-activated chloride channel family protein